jgi:hypothetical protein
MLNRRKLFYWLFKALSVIVSCALPIWAICEKFPIWKEETGVLYSIGIGAILILIVAAIIFRKSVFKFIEDKLKLQHAPPITVWIGCLIASYILIYIGNFMMDLNIVIWMGLIGCAIGNVLTLISNRFAEEEKKDNP